MNSNYFVLVPFILTTFCTFLNARVGEDRLTLEQRLNISGGYQYRQESVIQNRQRGMPYNKFIDFFPNQTEIRIYYKTLDGRKPLSKDILPNKMLEGWDVHVIYIAGKSVFELYRRSSNLNDFEFSALLKLQAGNSFWEKKQKEEDEPTSSAFGFDYEKKDGSLRAKKIGGNTLLIVSRQFDSFLAEELKNDQMESLPSSIKGF